MGKFKDVGAPSLVLMEELAEAIQVIAKKHRFNGDWDEIPEGKEVSRWAELCAEMEDVMYQFRRLEMQIFSKESSFPEPDPKDIDYPDDYDEMINQMMNEEQTDVMTDERDYEQELHPEYVIASTNLMMQETMVFCADVNGHITSFGDLNCIALRYGQEYWEDAFAAVMPLNTDEHKYIYVRTLVNDKNIHNLFRRIDTSDMVII